MRLWQCVAVVVVVLAVTSFVLARVHTKRPRPEAPRTLLQSVPRRVRLQTPDEQARVFAQLDEWAQACTRAGVSTWLSGRSRQAALQIGTMYPWDASVHVAYYVQPGTVLPRSVADLVHPAVISSLSLCAPGRLVPCHFGACQSMFLQEFDPPRQVGYVSRTVVVPRKLGLDVLRWPPHIRDTFTFRELVEGDVMHDPASNGEDAEAVSVSS